MEVVGRSAIERCRRRLMHCKSAIYRMAETGRTWALGECPWDSRYLNTATQVIRGNIGEGQLACAWRVGPS
jgi:hypothetical protein